ncbi:MAG TPA: phage major capsid protein [Phycisphaerae bacterium]|nr:phage major capsid protein [Phycisphaerae bacterium]
MLKKLREDHKKAVAELRKLAEPLREREFTAEEREKYDALKAEIDNLASRIRDLADLEARESHLSAPAGDGLIGREDTLPPKKDEEDREEEEEVKKCPECGALLRSGQRCTNDHAEMRALALQAWFRAAAQKDLSERQKQAAKACIARQRDGYRWYRDGGDLVIPLLNTRDARQLARERRAIGEAPMTVTTTDGGYLIPQGFVPQLERNMLAFGNVMQVAEVLRTDSGNDLPWPTIDFTAMTGEAKAINTAADGDKPTVGQTVFKAFKFDSKMILVPYELMQDSAFNMEAVLSDGIGEVIGRLMNVQLTTGVGTTAPKGIVTCASAGVTAASQTAFTADELLELEHSVDPAYRDPAFNCGFMSNDNTVLKIKQMKDGQGRYLFPEMRLPNPTFDGFPWYVNQQMASVAHSAVPVIFGAFRKYKVRLVGEIRLAVLRERYAELDQIGFIAWVRFDGNLVDAGTAPIKKLTMA